MNIAMIKLAIETVFSRKIFKTKLTLLNYMTSARIWTKEKESELRELR